MQCEQLRINIYTAQCNNFTLNYNFDKDYSFSESESELKSEF